MTNSKHIPKRRFKEFESDSDWEEQTLTDFIKLYNGLTYSPNDVRKNGTLVLRSSNIQSGEIINADNVYVSSDKATSENVRSGDIIVVVRNGSRSLIGKHAMVKGEMPNTVIGAFMSGMHSEHSTFVNALLDTPKFGKEIEKNMGATINQITGAMFSKMNFKIPSGIEQDYIGTFFYSIDSLITLHQHKLDKLKNLKKSYLAELFPAEGERVPKRRFPGFEGEWEIRKLKELTEYRRGSFPQPYGKNEWYGGIGSMPFVQVVDVLSNLKLAETTKQQISKLAQNQSVFVPQGTVVITLQGSIGRVAITQYDSYVDRTLLIFEKFLFPTDIYYWALSMQQKFDIESKKAPGGTIKTITKEALSEFEIFLPTLEEQKQIGEFFQKLDKSISLQQEKLNKLKDLKKAYLNELFV